MYFFSNFPKNKCWYFTKLIIKYKYIFSYIFMKYNLLYMFILYTNIVLVKNYMYFILLYVNGYSGRAGKGVVDENKQI